MMSSGEIGFSALDGRRKLLATSCATVALLLAPAQSWAQFVGYETFEISENAGDWDRDRTDAASLFNIVGEFQGRDDVLVLSVDPSKVEPNNFYNFQGYQQRTTTPEGNSFIRGDMYIDSSWATGSDTDYEHTGLWGAVSPSEDVANNVRGNAFFPIVHFSNKAASGETAAGRIIIYDSWTGSWVDLPGTAGVINYGDWNTLDFRLLPEDKKVEYYLNGTLIYTWDIPEYWQDNDQFFQVFLNAYNNGVTQFDTHWSRLYSGLLISGNNDGEIGDHDGDIQVIPGATGPATVGDGAEIGGILAGNGGETGQDINFAGSADLGGVTGNNTNFNFSSDPSDETNIDGNVVLENGSSTTGGSTDSSINVKGDVDVDGTSTFGGNFNVTGNVTSSGIISPGNSIGVHIYGSLDLDPTSSYEVDVNADGDSDLIAVDTTANLDGNVVVRTDEGIVLDTPYTILTAGTINGEFDHAEFEKDTAFLDALLDHNANDVQLTIERNSVLFVEAAETANQASVANALESLDIEGPLMTSIALSNFDEARMAFTQLSGEIHASVLTGIVEDSQAVRNAANDRIRAAFDQIGGSGADLLYAGEAAATSPGLAVWGSAYGWRATTDATDNSAEFDRKSAGFIAGVDTGFGDWRVGALAGYSRSSYDADALLSSADADHIHLGVYGGGQWGAVGLRTGLAYSWSDIDTSRTVTFMPQIETLTGSYKAGTFQVFGELGYRMDVQAASFEPFVNLAHVRTRADAFSETGGVAALDTAESTVNTTFSTVGLRAATELASAGASLHGMIGWRHAAGDIHPTVLHSIDGSDVFGVSGAPIARNAAVVEAGVNFGLGDAAKLDISYAGQYGSGTEQHGVKSILSFGF